MRKLFILFILSIAIIFPSFSSHYGGAELIYQCQGSNGDGTSNFLVTLTVYRDCRGEILEEFYDVPYTSSCDNGTLRLNSTSGLIEISPEVVLCGEESNCTDAASPVLGRQKRTYQATVTLTDCADYLFYKLKQLAVTTVRHFRE